MIEIENYSEFERYIHQKMLIIVSATWCKPCKIIKEDKKQIHVEDPWDNFSGTHFGY